MKKWWVKLLLAFGVVLLALSVCFFKSGSDSKTRLEQYRNQLRAAGEKLTPEELVPPRLDADKNGAAWFEDAAQFIAPRRATAIFTNPPAPMKTVAPGRASVAWRQDAIILTRRGLVTNTWEEIGENLANQGDALSKLQKAAERPQFDFAVDYRSLPISTLQLDRMRAATDLLSVQAIFDLHQGDAASSATHLQTLLAIFNAGRADLVPGSQITRINMIQKALAVQWEWLQATNITDEQLASLQACWTNVDIVDGTEAAMQMSRFTSDLVMNDMRAGGTLFVPSGPGVSGSALWGGSIRAFIESTRRRAGDGLWRNTWSYDDELNLWEGYQVMIETVRQARTNGYFQDAFAERERRLAALGLDHTNSNWLRTGLATRYNPFGAGNIRALANSLDRLPATEVMQRCAVTVIALKRYNLRRGTLPKDLSALVPEFLPAIPRDPVDGKSLRYRLNADGTFLLYSIGLDGIDNGGDATPAPPATSLWWAFARDWVWPQPATPAEVQNYYNHPLK
jgi:hypothetical protein